MIEKKRIKGDRWWEKATVKVKTPFEADFRRAGIVPGHNASRLRQKRERKWRKLKAEEGRGGNERRQKPRGQEAMKRKHAGKGTKRKRQTRGKNQRSKPSLRAMRAMIRNTPP